MLFHLGTASGPHFRAIFATAQDSIFVKDRFFRYVQVNPAMEHLTGRQPSFLARPILSCSGRKPGPVLGNRPPGAPWRAVKEVHTVPVLEVPTTFHVIKVPLHDDAGKIVGIRGIARDITDMKQAEAALQESEERFRMLFEHAPDAYILTDVQGEIIDCNQATEDLIGYGREELIGNNFACLPLLDFRQQARLVELLAQAAPGEIMGRWTSP